MERVKIEKKKLTKQELLKLLDDIHEKFGRDIEGAHGMADDALIDYIDDEEIRAAYDKIDKWYA